MSIESALVSDLDVLAGMLKKAFAKEDEKTAAPKIHKVTSFCSKPCMEDLRVCRLGYM